MEKNLTSMDIEKILSEYEDALFLRFEDEEPEELPEDIPPMPSIEKLLAGALRRKVAILKNKDYYQAKLMQLFKLTALLLDEEYPQEADKREACINYLLNQLFEDLTDVVNMIDTLPDLRSRRHPS